MRTLLALLCLTCRAQAETLQFGPGAGNRFALEVEKTGLLSGRKHLFEFERFRGQAQWDPAAPQKSRVEFVIEAASARCRDTWVSEKDLKKIEAFALKDMLAAAQYPEMRFVSSSVMPLGGDRYEVAGTLTLRGIDKPATVSVTRNANVWQGTARVRHTDYGLKPSRAALGAIGTKDEMTVLFTLTPR